MRPYDERGGLAVGAVPQQKRAQLVPPVARGVVQRRGAGRVERVRVRAAEVEQAVRDLMAQADPPAPSSPVKVTNPVSGSVN